MSDETHTPTISDPAYSTRPEGVEAYQAGIAYEGCPYIRGEDRWAWQAGWKDAWGNATDVFFEKYGKASVP